MSDDRNVWNESGSLSVQRSMDYDCNLVETWYLKLGPKLVLNDDMGDPLVHLYISSCNRVENGRPHKDHSVHDVMNFSEAPDEIQSQFIEQFDDLMEVREALG